MISVYEYLIKNSKYKPLASEYNGNDNGLQCNLVGDYSMTLVPDDGLWKNCTDIYTYINSTKFSKVMFLLFHNSNGVYDFKSLAHGYLPRKLRKDISGSLGYGMAGLELTNNDTVLNNGGVEFTIEEYINISNRLITKENIFDALFNSKLNDFIAMIECVWVYIYLCFEIEMSIFEILKSLKNPKVRIKAVQCKLKKEIDYKMLEVFKLAYDQSQSRR